MYNAVVTRGFQQQTDLGVTQSRICSLRQALGVQSHTVLCRKMKTVTTLSWYDFYVKHTAQCQTVQPVNKYDSDYCHAVFIIVQQANCTKSCSIHFFYNILHSDFQKFNSKFSPILNYRGFTLVEEKIVSSKIQSFVE